jgi:alpha-tubulin suppressor-like RCC1 family protein
MSQIPSSIRCRVRSRAGRCFIRGVAPALILAATACQDDPTAPNDATAPTPDVSMDATTQSAALSFLQLSGGDDHTCGVTSDHKAYCWGKNNSGQLGDGSTATRTRPTLVDGGLQFRQVSAGFQHSCGITTDYKAYCWGAGGDLGDGTETQRTTPVAVAGSRLYLRVETGFQHTCAVAKADRHAYCWGSNTSGQLGTGTSSWSLTPLAVSGGRSWRQVAAGFRHTCGIATGGAVFCWGSDSDGEIGDGSTRANRSVPTAIASGRLFTELDVGFDYSCAIATDSRAFCWGANGSGQIGDGSQLDRYTPRAVAGGLTFTRVATGSAHTCAEATGNKVYCWGNDLYGQFGDGSTENRTRPVPAAGGGLYTQVTSGSFFTCGISPSAAAYCWGRDEFGQLGDGRSGQNVKSTTPVPVLEP